MAVEEAEVAAAGLVVKQVGLEELAAVLEVVLEVVPEVVQVEEVVEVEIEQCCGRAIRESTMLVGA